MGSRPCARCPKRQKRRFREVRPSCFVASSGSEVWFILWEVKGAPKSWPISLHHAAYDGYELLSPTIGGWLAAELARVEVALAG